MATERIKTIKPSGGDYTSLSAAEAGEDDLGDLVSRDEWMHFSCYAMEDTTSCTIAGWDTDSTRKIVIDSPSGERHAGEWDTSKYRLATTNGKSLNIQQHYVTINDLQISVQEARNDYYPGSAVHCGYDYCGGLTLERTLFKGIAAASTSNGIMLINLASVYAAAAAIKIQNCGFIGSASTWLDEGISIDGSGQTQSMYIYNNTFKNLQLGIAHTNENAITIYAKNNGFVDCDDDLYGTISATTNSTSSPTFASGKEFHLASNDTTWHGQGTDLSADAGRISSNDIDGEARGSTWDIGCDQYVAVAGGSPRGHVFMRPFVGAFRRAL